MNTPFSPNRQRAVASHTRLPSATTERGAASLIVVMVLFFLMSLVAAYTSRNLIFEQRTSLNQQRSTQGLEAAEAGMEWAIAMLNSGRITETCTELGAVAADTSFRQRYLAVDAATGVLTPQVRPTGGGPMTASCVHNGVDWACSCPKDAVPNLVPPVGNGIFPAFSVRFTTFNVKPGLPGAIRVESNGCTQLNPGCLDFLAAGTLAGVEGEGRASMSVIAVLKSGLSASPSAALTVVGNVVGGSVIRAYNTDASRGGVAIHARGAVNDAGFVVRGIPGSPSTHAIERNDATLAPLAGVADSTFSSIFAGWPTLYRWQPGAVRFTCAAGGCRSDLAAVVATNPGRVIWVEGDLTLETAGDVGSPPDLVNPAVAGPAVIVVNGSVLFTAAGNVRIFGMVYSRSGNWTGSGEIRGAAFVEGNLAAAAAPTVVMEADTLDFLRQRHGSFVRVPASWRDY